jgi:hypothetical protein
MASSSYPGSRPGKMAGGSTAKQPTGKVVAGVKSPSRRPGFGKGGPAGHGRSATAPGQMKRAAGAKSARSFAPGQTKKPATPVQRGGHPGAGVKRGGAPGARVAPTAAMKARGKGGKNAFQSAADVAGKFGGAGQAIGRGVGQLAATVGAIPGKLADRVTAPSPIKRAMSSESTHALDNVLGRKR